MATEAALFATFTIERGASDATDVPFGTLTGPLQFAGIEKVSDGPNSTKYQVVCTYIAGTDQALEYTIIRKTFVTDAAVEVDTALATIAGLQKWSFLQKVSDSIDGKSVTYDIIVLHLNT